MISWLTSIVAALNANGMTNVFCLELAEQQWADVCGADYYPNVITPQKMPRILTTALLTRLDGNDAKPAEAWRSMVRGE